MIITKTPYRISLFGGGTDMPKWYKQNRGAVVSFAVDKYCYIVLRDLPIFSEHAFKVTYSLIETVNQVSDIHHPAFREAIKKYAALSRLEINHLGDLPARSGIGSSSTFAVGLINALNLWSGKALTSEKLANLAIEFEQKDLLENVGSQDQIACATGGLNLIEFGPEDRWQVTPFNVSNDYRKKIESWTVLAYSGITRYSSDISKHLIDNLEKHYPLLNRTAELAYICNDIFRSEGDLSQIGTLLNESWEIKKILNPFTSTEALNSLILKAKDFGAIGSKVLGAGGGGFCLFWVDPENRNRFIENMNSLKIIPVAISDEGTTQIK